MAQNMNALIQQYISERNKSGSAFLLELSVCKLYEEILIRLYGELSKLYLYWRWVKASHQFHSVVLQP